MARGRLDRSRAASDGGSDGNEGCRSAENELEPMKGSPLDGDDATNKMKPCTASLHSVYR